MKQAFVTGGNKGLGFEIAKQLGQQGWQVIIGSRDAKRGEEAVNQLRAAGLEEPQSVELDLSNSQTIQAAAKTITDNYHELQLLVNNAGIPGDLRVAGIETTMADLRETMEVNFFGTFELTQVLFPLLKQNQGQVANITIPTTPNKLFNPFAYQTSKGAQNVMTTSLATLFETTDTPVEIFSVHPGPVSTDLNGNLQADFMQSAEEAAAGVVRLITSEEPKQGAFLEVKPAIG
ncbi:Short chain dehydrogenase [Furfurilactobacillus rossiae]|uniref:SDR family NAD(P)-dependent oxidoreductase n=1 Tax=Furfurilactobacillus rossiae TaxID=231049 RepID=UPI0015BBCA42|nr:SDR family NAD(P)-dependent oxidoreductase [Furfurilactobacillus rossiae]MCF6165616.1 SDR family NAD(P)-dependent oxidoreductase [Furfurilactobacillus rossiae]QLE63431.1 Short chain dehydrogenase [Furfurilactobacillus rossiae]